jgi:hypothetical protein
MNLVISYCLGALGLASYTFALWYGERLTDPAIKIGFWNTSFYFFQWVLVAVCLLTAAKIG